MNPEHVDEIVRKLKEKDFNDEQIEDILIDVEYAYDETIQPLEDNY